jgi:hypothetical protein
LRVVSTGFGSGLGGLDEVQIPGLRVHETLRLPTTLAREASGMNLSRNPMAVVLQRTTADFPYRSGADVEAAQASNPFDAVDAEPGLERQVMLPAARSFTLDGWASVNPASPDTAFDRIAGIPDGWSFTSSGRFEGWPIHRASSAFDGNARSAWVGNDIRNQRTWIALRAPQRFGVERFRLQPLSDDYAFPTLLQVQADGGFRRNVPVAADGMVELPRRVVTSNLRLNVLSLRGPFGPRALRAVAIAEIDIPGLSAPRPRRHGEFTTRCGEISVTAAGQRATASAIADIAQLDAGRPLPLSSCGDQSLLHLPAGTVQLSAAPGEFLRPDHLRLLSQAPVPTQPANEPSAAVLDPGHSSNGRRDGVRLNVPQRSWLVFGESYSKGWRAWCTGSSGRQTDLGKPVPIDGFANGWLAPAGCTSARFYFQPQKRADAAYLISAVGVGLMLLFVGAGLALRRRRAYAPQLVEPERWTAPASDPVRTLGLREALAVAVLAAGIGGFLFALRAGAVIGPVTFVALRLGVNVRRLLVAALIGLALLPLAYIASPSPDVGGFYYYYALHYIDEHWLALGVVCALAVAVALMAWDLLERKPSRSLGAGRLARLPGLRLRRPRAARGGR